MRRSGYELTLLDDAERPLPTSPSGHVQALPGRPYVIALRNTTKAPAVAVVSVDGKVVSGQDGILVESRGLAWLYHPVGDRGRFTAFHEGASAVLGASGGRDNPSLGLVEVRFQAVRLPTHDGIDEGDMYLAEQSVSCSVGPRSTSPVTPSVLNVTSVPNGLPTDVVGRGILPDAGNSLVSEPSYGLSSANFVAEESVVGGLGAGGMDGHDTKRSLLKVSALRSASLSPRLGQGRDVSGLSAAGTGLTDWSGVASPTPAPRSVNAIGKPVNIALRLVDGDIGTKRVAPDTEVSGDIPVRPEARS